MTLTPKQLDQIARKNPVPLAEKPGSPRHGVNYWVLILPDDRDELVKAARELEELRRQDSCPAIAFLAGPEKASIRCGYERGHTGPHSWQLIPTLTEAVR